MSNLEFQTRLQMLIELNQNILVTSQENLLQRYREMGLTPEKEIEILQDLFLRWRKSCEYEREKNRQNFLKISELKAKVLKLEKRLAKRKRQHKRNLEWLKDYRMFAKQFRSSLNQLSEFLP